jgi:hypothetical protein
VCSSAPTCSWSGFCLGPLLSSFYE